VVAAAVGGLGDAVEDGVTGVLFPAGDVPSLREAVVRLLDDPDRRRRLGRAARAHALRELSHARSSEILRAAYADALAT
jgi:glycosyltransferase involved in cell wall biosynthesis